MIYLAYLSRYSDMKRDAQQYSALAFYFPGKGPYHFPPRLQRHPLADPTVCDPIATAE